MWENHTVPFLFSAAVSLADRAVIWRVMAEIQVRPLHSIVLDCLARTAAVSSSARPAG